jgi:hypothetical protein
MQTQKHQFLCDPNSFSQWLSAHNNSFQVLDESMFASVSSVACSWYYGGRLKSLVVWAVCIDLNSVVKFADKINISQFTVELSRNDCPQVLIIYPQVMGWRLCLRTRKNSSISFVLNSLNAFPLHYLFPPYLSASFAARNSSMSCCFSAQYEFRPSVDLQWKPGNLSWTSILISTCRPWDLFDWQF